MLPKRSWPAISHSCSRTTMSLSHCSTLRAKSTPICTGFFWFFFLVFSSQRRSHERGTPQTPHTMNSVSRTDKGGEKTYGRLVVQRKDVVYISLDNARLARANVADDEDLVQVLLDFTGVALFFPLGRVDFFPFVRCATTQRRGTIFFSLAECSRGVDRVLLKSGRGKVSKPRPVTRPRKSQWAAHMTRHSWRP